MSLVGTASLGHFPPMHTVTSTASLMSEVGGSSMGPGKFAVLCWLCNSTQRFNPLIYRREMIISMVGLQQ
jgi:hypothetical protein